MTETPVEFAPIRFLGQLPADGADGPRPYMTNIGGPLGSVQSDLHWHLFDLCRFHQVMYGDLRCQVAQLDERFQHYRQLLHTQKASTTDDYLEGYYVQESRIFSKFLDKDKEVVRLKHFADEFCVIGLWATAEQYLSRVFAEIESRQTGKQPSEIKMSHKWDIIKAKFRRRSIVLESLDHFPDADECRVLNNSIKHAQRVDDRLARYAFFSAHKGSRLTMLDFELQRYLNGVSDLLGSLIEAVNRQLDPAFPY